MVSLEIVDRTLFEYIRREVVTQGLLPDWRTFNVGTINERQIAYEAAKSAMRESGELVEVYGVGSAKARGTKAISMITVDRKNVLNGSVGGSGVVYTDNGDDTFSKHEMPDSTCNVIYEIRGICNTTASERKTAKALANVFGRRRGIKALDLFTEDFDGEHLIIESQGSVSLNTDDFIEWVHTFQIVDAWIDEAVLISANIVPLTTVNIKTYVCNRLQEFEQGTALPIQIIT